MDFAARDAWLKTHPFLEGIARFQAAVDDASAAGAAPIAPPDLDALAGEQKLGVPLLASAAARLGHGPPAADLLGLVLERLGGASLPGKLGAACRALRTRLRAPEERARAIAWIASGQGEAPPDAGLLRFLGWTALARVLAPVVAAVEARGGGEWTQPLCPTCGAPPAMAQLVESPAGKQRLLSCGGCRTRWRWKRIGCPFCEEEAADRQEALEIEGEPLRIDLCSACKGYLKTYVGEGEEALFLADWTSLHLDALAAERGLERRAASLYEV
jgi:FdhE protein